MGKEDRRRLLLKFLNERNVALPPKVLYNNLLLYETITFSDKTVQRLLLESEELGLVENINFGHSHYRITNKGRKYLRGDINIDELEVNQ